MITKEEIGSLLLFVSAFDNRTIGRADVEAWHSVAAEGRWPSFEVARRAVVKHQSKRPDDRIRPGHVSEIIREVREFAARVFRQPPIPDDVRGAEQRDAWVNEQYRTWIAEYMAAWAAGDESPGPDLRHRLRALPGGGAA